MIRPTARHQQCAYATTDIWDRFVQNRRAIVVFLDPRATLISTVALIIIIALLPVMAVVLCATQPIAHRNPFASVQTDIRESIATIRLASSVIMDPLAAFIKIAAQDTRIAVSPATAIVLFATRMIAHQNQSVSAPTDTRDNTARYRLRRTNLHHERQDRKSVV